MAGRLAHSTTSTYRQSTVSGGPLNWLAGRPAIGSQPVTDQLNEALECSVKLLLIKQGLLVTAGFTHDRFRAPPEEHSSRIIYARLGPATARTVGDSLIGAS